MNCKYCDIPARSIESRKTTTGRRRVYECQLCRGRFTTFQPQAGAEKMVRYLTKIEHTRYHLQRALILAVRDDIIESGRLGLRSKTLGRQIREAVSVQ